VPEGYFETLPDRVLAAIDNEPDAHHAPVVSLFRHRLRTIAASVAILLFSGLAYALVTEVIIPALRSGDTPSIEEPITPTNAQSSNDDGSGTIHPNEDHELFTTPTSGVPTGIGPVSNPPAQLPLFRSGQKPVQSTQGAASNYGASSMFSTPPMPGTTSGYATQTSKGITGTAAFSDTVVCRGSYITYSTDHSSAEHQFVWHLNGKVVERHSGPSMEVNTGMLTYGTQRVSLVVTSLKTKQIVSVLNAAIQVVEAPQSRGTREICSYDKATLNAGSIHPHWEYQWSNGAQSPVIDVTRTGTYWITIRLKGGNCQVTDTFHVKVMPKPSLALGTERTTCTGDKVNLAVSDPTESYQFRWMPGNSTSSDYQFTQNTPGLYRVNVRVTGCEVHTAEVKIKVNDCRITIPNVFTPNGDGINDLFVITGLEAYPGSVLIVTDRNGRVVYEHKDYDNSWNGQDLPEATYFYTFLPGGQPEMARKGTVNIRR
jgi:gliding motility-associated-like protein